MTSGAVIPQPARPLQPARLLAAAFLAFLPLKVMSLGYVPPDDALRHAAKAVSGRPWSEILVLRPGITEDQHPGWHAILGAVHRFGGADAFDLVFFSVVVLFTAFVVVPLFLLRRPEPWLLSLLVLTVFDPSTMARLMLGRPFLVSAAYVAVFALVWPRLAEARAPAGTLGLVFAATTLSSWVHGSWYLLALPVIASALARQWRVCARLAAATGAGVLAGAILAGHPLRFLFQAVYHGYLALGAPEPSITLVSEFQPFDGKPLVVGALLAVLVWRRGRREGLPRLDRDPAFALVVVGWVLGYAAIRFYSDWAVPALLAFLAREIEHEVVGSPELRGLPPVGPVLALGVVLVFAIGSDAGGRWTAGNDRAYVVATNPEHAPCLPDPGGILYSTDMVFFYRTFFRNPEGRWRYILGFEPTLMPPEDLAVFREIRSSRGATDAYRPWLAKMRPQDRLWIRQAGNVPPPVPGLEWYQPVVATWCGRLPR